ncbi:hypothetical protein [uncultured Polaribacter sp.]|uniref:hypothetical protein n=1 Tax=uncultured Polaribacter sp. TaxID=174711 RepID=UPI002638FF42|nr:hypothetical protein [uncultured Polaribacter sp.]
MNKTSDLEILQLHYYLSDNEHSMDAIVYNKAESELLKIVTEVSKILDLDVLVEIQALEEGGIKSIYKFLNKKKNRRKIQIVGAFFAGIVATIISDVVSDNIKSDPEMERMKKEKLELEIRKLKKELSEQQEIPLEETEEQLVISQEFINDLSIYISELNQVKISKSKFYKTLLNEGKIEKVSTQELNKEFEPKKNEKFVPRKDFKLFIIEETDIDSDYENNVTLEIASPVLTSNRMNWKALYNNEQINFSLKDKNFKSLIINKNLKFTNGTKIVCDLETKQKMTDDGEIIKKGRAVYNVTKIIYPNGDIIDI